MGAGPDEVVAPTDHFAAEATPTLPEPGPFTSTDKTFMPHSIALTAAASAATCAAYGVDFLDPLKPLCPAEAQDITLPLVSAIVIIVLLNVD